MLTELSKPGRRRALAALGVLGAGASLSPLLRAQDSAPRASTYPNHPVRIIVAGPAGGGTDFVARLLAERLSRIWNQAVVVENRAGASGVIGSRYVEQSGPDGYTLILGQSGTHAIVPFLQKPSPYDPVRDFVPVIEVSTAPDLLVVSADSPIKSYKDLIDTARDHAGIVTYGSAGVGLPQHLIGFRMAQLAGVQMRHIPYKGSPPGLTDLMGGQITSMLVTAAAVMPLIKSGRIRALASNAAHRLPTLPDVPTFAELGVAVPQESGWNGLFAPAGTPKEVVARINAATQQVLAENEVRKLLAESYVTPVGNSPEDFARFHQEEVRRWTALIEQSGVKVN